MTERETRKTERNTSPLSWLGLNNELAPAACPGALVAEFQAMVCVQQPAGIKV